MKPITRRPPGLSTLRASTSIRVGESTKQRLVTTNVWSKLLDAKGRYSATASNTCIYLRRSEVGDEPTDQKGQRREHIE